MALKNIFCPNCGKETQVNDEKLFCFCLHCGKKIILKTDAQSDSMKNTIKEGKKSGIDKSEINKKLEEVKFYYKLSQEKNERSDYNNQPTYYLKAQDILVDLSEQYPDDYRIWWELCKPIDFYAPLSAIDLYDKYTINLDYFDKALDRAELPEKKRLIDEHDQYLEAKRPLREKAEKKRIEEEEKRKAAEKAERDEEERSREEERKRQVEIMMQQEEKQQQEQRRKEEEGLTLNTVLWQSLYNKDYMQIDNTFFNMQIENNQTVIGVFKNVSNVMYLMAFRIDGSKGNTIYREQTISIKFDGNGHGIKFDNTPVRIKGMLPPKDVLSVASNGSGEFQVNGMELHNNPEYVSSIMKNAKKPMLSFSKVFL